MILSSPHLSPSARPGLRGLPSITQAADFARGLKQRPQARASHFALYRLDAALGDNTLMLGLVIPKRALRRAHDRNCIRRIVKEAFRLQQQRLPACGWIVRLSRTPAWAKQPPREFRHNCRAEIEALLAQVPQPSPLAAQLENPASQ